MIQSYSYLIFVAFSYLHVKFAQTKYLLIHFDNHLETPSMMRDEFGNFSSILNRKTFSNSGVGRSIDRRKWLSGGGVNIRELDEGCKCNCLGECEPKGCKGPMTSSRSMKGYF